MSPSLPARVLQRPVALPLLPRHRATQGLVALGLVALGLVALGLVIQGLVTATQVANSPVWTIRLS